MPPKPSAFDDRTLTLKGARAELARVADVFASPTRVAVLDALRASPEPLHINEIARRVGVDASPVRTHLELLVKAALAEEVEGAGRLRRFTTRLTDVRVTMEGVKRAGPAKPPQREPPKEVARLERKLADYGKRMDVLREKAARVQREMDAAWAEHGRDA